MPKQVNRIPKEDKPLIIGGCVWCDAMLVLYDPKAGSMDEMLKRHVLRDCKGHPMRKLERKLKRLASKLDRGPRK